ncbi:FMN-binding negative transcriptional regulator [Brevibacillus sp. SYP-B805]|uniref:FMN-binding negative transcriptional regulator n=1 Tax=Brevibacillus sp. SYP-B805 TaxID=1578199 RepID=UPI0013E9A9B8|nr:FMN-binding negative transcriptional regulator [Brevibacillus sp. SYP-B805]NGQ95724.1 FMN-binding negative transcriptional regulator [Brevibacillus sp. SYP-B805]
MYVPKAFEITDRDEVITFLQEHPFATLVTINDGKPFATHLPLELEKNGDQLFLTGHLAAANPQWRHFSHNESVLAMFQGPHAYISASWYTSSGQVPTWNYMAVHVYGKARVVEESRLRAMLKEMLAKYEGGRENGVLWEQVPAADMEKLLKAIVGFELEVERIEAKYKLSQNKNKEDVQAVIRHLAASHEPVDQQVAAAMRCLHQGV